MSLQLYDIAHARAGDKGNCINISVIAREKQNYALIVKHLTSEIVFDTFSHLAHGPVTRYELPKLIALNFVIENLRGGGVTSTLAMDIHGKSLSYLMLSIKFPDNISI